MSPWEADPRQHGAPRALGSARIWRCAPGHFILRLPSTTPRCLGFWGPSQRAAMMPSTRGRQVVPQDIGHGKHIAHSWPHASCLVVGAEVAIAKRHVIASLAQSEAGPGGVHWAPADWPTQCRRLQRTNHEDGVALGLCIGGNRTSSGPQHERQAGYAAGHWAWEGHRT